MSRRQTAYRDRMKAEHRCLQCGGEDARTRSGLSRCEPCKERQLEQQRARLGLAVGQGRGRPAKTG